MTTSNDPDEIRADIERTRAALSNDVDELAETVKPKNVAQRQVDKVKEAASNVKDRVMGSDDDYSGSAVGTVTDRTSSAKDAVAIRRTRHGRQSATGPTRPETQSAKRPPKHARLWAGLRQQSGGRRRATRSPPALSPLASECWSPP